MAEYTAPLVTRFVFQFVTAVITPFAAAVPRPSLVLAADADAAPVPPFDIGRLPVISSIVCV